MRLEPLPSLSKNPVDAFDTEQLVQILGCSRTTARRYQSKTQTPRPAEIAYLRALSERRIMPDEWPKTMYFRRDKLVTPIDREPLTWAQVQQSQWVQRQLYATTDFLGKIERGLKGISERLTLTELSKIKPIQKEIRQVMDVENPMSHTARQRQWFRRNGC